MKKKVTKTKKSIMRKLWEYTDKHPRVDRVLHGLAEVPDKFMLAYFIFAVALIAIPVIIAYCALPEEIRNGSSAIIGSIMSLIVIPLIMNEINRKKENENKRFESNKDLYMELSNLLIQIQVENGVKEDNKENFQNFIVSNYNYMCVNFSSSLISEIYRTYRAYTNNQMENVRIYAEKCMKYICKEGGNGKEFMYSSLIFELMEKK